MIDKIKLKFGSSQGQPNLEFDVTPITVFVGPNNSGKSKVLVEIEMYAKRTHGQSNDLLLDNLIFTPLTQAEIEEEIARIEQTPNPGENIDPGHVILGKVNPSDNNVIRFQVNKA